ncbi:putative hydrolases or acyltransferase [Calycina marina]|uniref:Hydrolases or acyltransferase n=1 Tax=Calycina marina TaxID=1763456 RepID=A0A9P7ZCP7_9HELO|nr:putative hydrolases or acyltransferase [Calycina marina]
MSFTLRPRDRKLTSKNDCRGHGSSSQPWECNGMDLYATELHDLLAHLKITKDAMLVGHWTGGGEVRVSKLIGAVPLLMAESESHRDDIPTEVFDGYRSALLKKRAQFFYDLATRPFFGFNRNGVAAGQALIQSWWQQGMMCVLGDTFDGGFDEHWIPLLLLHVDDDQIVPIDGSARRAVKFLKHGTLKEYKGASYALPSFNVNEVNRDLLDVLNEGLKD